MSDVSTVCERKGNRAAPWILTARLRDLRDLWIQARCGTCDHQVITPTRLLIQRHGENYRLRDLLDRAVCKHCRAKIATVNLNETPHTVDRGGTPPGWSVQRVPLPCPDVEAAE